MPECQIVLSGQRHVLIFVFIGSFNPKASAAVHVNGERQ